MGKHEITSDDLKYGMTIIVEVDIKRFHTFIVIV